MRIIGGRLAGIRLQPPNNLPVRPTTDQAKESLFNILNSRFDFDGLRVLDLFSGTGNMAFEFASRGSIVDAVDRHFNCVRYIKDVAEKHQLPIQVFKEDAFKFINRASKTYDLIFSDPPYDLPELPEIPRKINEGALLEAKGLFILEHPSMKKLDQMPGFSEQRKYGSTSFSFFTFDQTEK